jgi:hypothetical protein
VRIPGRGVFFFRQFQETVEVVPPIPIPALHHQPDWLFHTADVIDFKNSINFQYPTLLL